MRSAHVRKGMAIVALATLIPASGWAVSGPGGGKRQGPPPEAFTACEGKSAGDKVTFTNRRGETMEATCREMDGKLVAFPDKGRGYGKGMDGKRGMDGARRLERMTAALNLTEPQQEQVRAILDREQEKTAPLREKMMETRDKMRSAVHSGTAEESAIRSLAADQARIKGDLMVARAQSWKEIQALLTPEQQEKAKEFQKNMGPGMGKGNCRSWN